MHASNDTLSVANVPRQQAVKLVVVGPGFVLAMFVWIVFGRSVAMKSGMNWEMALQSFTLTLKLSLKMPYFPDLSRKLHFCYVQDRRSYQMESCVFKNLFLS